MKKTTKTNPSKIPDKIKELLPIAMEPLVLRRGAPGRRIELPDLRSPDELSGRWKDVPEEKPTRKENEQSSQVNGKD